MGEGSWLGLYGLGGLQLAQKAIPTERLICFVIYKPGLDGKPEKGLICLAGKQTSRKRRGQKEGHSGLVAGFCCFGPYFQYDTVPCIELGTRNVRIVTIVSVAIGKVRVLRVAWCYGCQAIGLWRGPAPDVSKIAVYYV